MNLSDMSLSRKVVLQNIAEKYESLKGHLNEKAKRCWAASEAQSYGWGGVTLVHEATGIDHKTIRKGVAELQQASPESRIRRKGGGRKKLTKKAPTLLASLEEIVEATTRGDPESPLRWTSKSSAKITKALQAKGYQISPRSTSELLTQELNYSLQSNRKTLEGSSHPDRDAQFQYINQKTKQFQEAQCPTLSVDTKKKENIGNYKNPGREYAPKEKPILVKGHDFPDKKLGKVSPYGVYDIGKNQGWVSVGISADTAAFAVNTLRAWWYGMGKGLYADAAQILVTADGGGSNGHRVRLWKVELQKLANEIRKEIHVCHFPPGTSKWNKIEHRMFSYISMNWRGKPLISQEVVVQLIGNTKTDKGLKIQAILDENTYKKGIKISDQELGQINLTPDSFHGEWNYVISPQPYQN